MSEKMNPPEKQVPLGRMVFNRLRAENEIDWLEQVYVRPSVFDALCQMGSSVVFGEEGAGKTALARMLLAEVKNTMQPFIVEWQPQLPKKSLTHDVLVEEFFLQIQGAVALDLLRLVARQPELFEGLNERIKREIISFIHQYVVDFDDAIERLEDDASEQGLELLKWLSAQKPEPVYQSETSHSIKLEDLIYYIQKLRRDGIWVVIDRLEAWLNANEQATVENLRALLSALGLFDHSNFAIKIFLPGSLQQQVLSCTAIRNNWLDEIHLSYEIDELVKIVNRRLAAVFPDYFQEEGLNRLCPSPKLQEWLEVYGGNLPRGWLELTRGLVDKLLTFLPNPRPLSEAEFELVITKNPPRLQIDLSSDQVYLGYRLVENIQAKPYQLLRYLYTKPTRQCTREELYYKGHKGLETIPRFQDKDHELRDKWEQTLDTTLRRLREQLEPDPANPIYISSLRGKKIVRLDNVR